MVWTGKTQWVVPSCKVWHSPHVWETATLKFLPRWKITLLAGQLADPTQIMAQTHIFHASLKITYKCMAKERVWGWSYHQAMQLSHCSENTTECSTLLFSEIIYVTQNLFLFCFPFSFSFSSILLSIYSGNMNPSITFTNSFTLFCSFSGSPVGLMGFKIQTNQHFCL